MLTTLLFTLAKSPWNSVCSPFPTVSLHSEATYRGLGADLYDQTQTRNLWSLTCYIDYTSGVVGSLLKDHITHYSYSYLHEG